MRPLGDRVGDLPLPVVTRAGHTDPAAVYLREGPVREAVNGRLAELVDPANLDPTVRPLLDGQEWSSVVSDHAQARRRLADAGARLRWFHDAIGAGDTERSVHRMSGSPLAQ